MNLRKKHIASLFGAVVMSSAQAAIVDHGIYLTDTVTGLDWLDVTTTAGKSYNQVFAQLGSGGAYDGWRYASGDEFNALIGSWTGATPAVYGVVDQELDKIDGLVALLGDTLDYSFLIEYGKHSSNEYGNDIRYTFGMLSDSPSLPGYCFHWIAGISDADISPYQFLQDNSVAHAAMYGCDNVRLDTGSYLVRNSIQSVPETSTIALLGLGLFGTAFARRQKKAK